MLERKAEEKVRLDLVDAVSGLLVEAHAAQPSEESFVSSPLPVALQNVDRIFVVVVREVEEGEVLQLLPLPAPLPRYSQNYEVSFYTVVIDASHHSDEVALAVPEPLFDTVDAFFEGGI